MQSLDPTVEIGLFLHIPCLPPDNFFTKYNVVAFPILRGLLRFTKVGVQTVRDRSNLVRLVQEHLPTAKIVHESEHQQTAAIIGPFVAAAPQDVVIVTYQGWTCSLGVFPASIKNEDFLKVARASETVKRSHDIRKLVGRRRDFYFYYLLGCR